MNSRTMKLMSIVADEQLDVLDRSHPEDSLNCYGGGGGKGVQKEEVPQVIPTPAVEEASVQIEDEDKKDKKASTSKSQLKVPLSPTVDTGLNL